MPSNVARGAKWKARSRRWLEGRGYIAVDLEIVRQVYTPNGFFPQKRDQLGCDLLGVASDGSGYLWVQVKGYSVTRPSLAAAKRLLLSFPRPPATQKCILLWKLRAREPEVIECS